MNEGHWNSKRGLIDVFGLFSWCWIPFPTEVSMCLLNCKLITLLVDLR